MNASGVRVVILLIARLPFGITSFWIKLKSLRLLAINFRFISWFFEEDAISLIDFEYKENNTISVKFSEVGSETQSLFIDEFIDLVASYEDNEDNNKDNNDNNTQDEESVCLIM